MGEYFRIINAAKEQYLENPLSDNKWYNILARGTDTVRILTHLICQGPVEHELAGSWSGCALFIVGDDSSTPDEYGVSTTTKEKPERTLYSKAEDDYKCMADAGDAMLETLRHRDYETYNGGSFLVANLTKKQYIDPLSFEEGGLMPDQALGGMVGQATAYLYCRFERNSYPGSGSWSKDQIVLVPENKISGTTIAYHDVLQDFENVGYLAIRLLENHYQHEDTFPLLAKVNPNFLEQLLLANIRPEWVSAAENLSSSQRKEIVLKSITMTVQQWAFSSALLAKLTQRMSSPNLSDQVKNSAEATKYLESLRNSLNKKKDTTFAHDAGSVWKVAYAQMQKIYQSDTPCGITVDDIEQALEGREEADLESESESDSRKLVSASAPLQSSESAIPVDAHGNVDLKERQDITTLPDGFAVKGILSLAGCTALTSLPAGLSVGQDLTLTRCIALTSLPKGLKVGRSLWLTGCTKLGTLPDDITIGGNLMANASGITTLPETFSVGGMIDLRNSPISTLPKSLKVGGTLELDGCTGISTLPEELSVGGDLRLCHCSAITELPEGMSVKGTAYFLGCHGLTKLPKRFSIGTLLLDGTSIEELPDGLNITGDLSLGGCKGLTELPENLFVGGGLTISNCTGLTRLPEKFAVGGSLFASGCTSIKQLPPQLTVGKNLVLKDCTGISELPHGLAVDGDLDITGCTELSALPEGLKVGGDLDASGCSKITKLPQDFSIGGSLTLTGCTKLTELPVGLSVNGNLILRQCTSLKVLPDSLSVNGYLDLRGCSGITTVPDGISVKDNIIGVDAFDPSTESVSNQPSERQTRLAELGQMLQKPDGLKRLVERALQSGQEQLNLFKVEGTGNGGAVKILSTGNLALQSVEIATDAITPEDVGALEKLLLAALNDVADKTRQELEQIKLRALTGSLKI